VLFQVDTASVQIDEALKQLEGLENWIKSFIGNGFYQTVIEATLVANIGVEGVNVQTSYIGVGAGKCLGMRSIFDRISSNLPEKFVRGNANFHSQNEK